MDATASGMTRPRTSSTAAYALIMMMCASFFSFLDRHIFALLVPLIQKDLTISDTQIGLLQGFAFGMFYSVMAMPFGWAVDRFNRRNIVAFGFLCWSLATVGSGLSTSFTTLMLCRMAVGVGEAVLMPAAYSMIADLFEPNQRGRALGVFTTANFLGGGLAYLAGGALIGSLHGAHDVVLPVLGRMAVWQAAFAMVGLPGGVLAVLFLTVSEPVRRKPLILEHEAAVAGASLTGYIRRNLKAFVLVYGAYTLFTYVSFGLQPWAPTLFVRRFGLSVPQAGFYVGIGQLVTGIIGSLLGGVLGDRWTASKRPGGKFRLTLIWWVVGLPLIAGITLAPVLGIMVGAFCAYFLAVSMAYVSASAVIQDMVPANLRGRATALWYMVTGVVGQGCGPIATALITDHVFHSQAALPYSIILMAAPAMVLGLFASLAGLRPQDRLREEVVARDLGRAPAYT